MSLSSPQESWTIQRVLAWTQEFFAEKGIETARLDAELLLASVLGVGRITLYTHFDKPLSAEERQAYRGLVKRRAAREPVATILGQKEFFSRDFAITREVLTPRPETEHLVDAVLEWVRREELTEPRVLDVGTGSGNIAITLACELEGATVLATDIDERGLAVAKQNAEAHGVSDRVELLAGDLFAPIQNGGAGPFDVVVSNPPYVDSETRDSLAPEVREWEPARALFADEGGMAVIHRLCSQVSEHLARPGLFALEIGADQADRTREALEGAGDWAHITLARDLQDHPRVIVAEKRGSGLTI